MPGKPILERVDACEKFEVDLQTELVNHASELRGLKADVEGLIQILGLFRTVPYFQDNAVYAEITQKLNAVIAAVRERHPDLKPFDVS